MWAFSFLNDTDTSLWKDILKMLWTDNNAYLLEPYFWVLTAVITFISTLGSFSVIAAYHRMKVSSRKYFVIFYWMLGLVLAAALGLMTIGIEIVALSTIPVAFFISYYLLSDNKQIWKEILTWIYLATMIFSLYFYK